jgi:hypothetical protein
MKKVLSTALVLTIGTIFAVNFFVYKHPGAEADAPSTSVQIQNVLPVITVAAAEATASYATVPSAIGASVTFQATATDANTDQWKLLVCKTAGTTGVACDGGGSDMWCNTATAVNSGSQATCSYTAATGDAWSNAWFAYACDATGCSTVDQGAGNSGSPFFTNHLPAITVSADDSAKNPGQTVTWTSTSSDPDTSSTVQLFVCKTASFNGTVCAGGQWCSSSAVASNASCQYAIPSVYPDANYSSYTYIVDNFGVQGSGGQHGVDTTLTVSNVAPSIAAASIQLLDSDESGNITLTTPEANTTGFKVKFTVVDNNSCQNSVAGNEISSSFINVFRSGVTSAGCDAVGEADLDDCYPDASATWNPTCTQDGSTCSGTTDSDAAWTCTFPLGYNVDPTVAGATYAAENWLASVQATDDDSANTGLVVDADGNEVDMFMAYQVTTASISYGNLNPGGDSSEASTVTKARGNVGVDQQLSGTNMTSGGDSIAVGQQKYNLTAAQGWTAGTALSTTPTEVEINVAKPKVGALTPTKSAYWVLRIPAAQKSGTYSGTNTITGVTGESAGW